MSHRDRVIALAGAFQAARLVQQLARDGRCDKDALRAAVASIFKLDAASTEDVFGGAQGVRLGLLILRDRLLDGTNPEDVELARYVVALLQLETVLQRNRVVLEAIRKGIDAAQTQMKFFEASDGDDDDALHPRLAEKLADVYTQTVSTLTPRIMVNGEHGYLNNPLIAAKVRTALLAGIRAAVLWRQMGGNRWQLLIGRKKIAIEAGLILETLDRAAGD